MSFVCYENVTDSVPTAVAIEALHDHKVDEPYTLRWSKMLATDARKQYCFAGKLKSALQGWVTNKRTHSEIIYSLPGKRVQGT